MGGISAYSLTLLDVLIKRINGKDPYDSPHHDLAVLCQPSGQAWRRAAEGSTGFGDVYPAMALERLGEDAHGDLIYTFTRPWSDGTTGITLSPLELLEKLAAVVPLPRVHLVRYAGCLAPHSQLRGAIIPTPRQQGVDGREASVGTPCWSWARLLKRVFDLDLSTYPLCRRGSLRIIAAITHEAVITRILRHLKLAAVPPPIAPARARQETFDWVA